MANYNFSYDYDNQQPYLNRYYQQQVPGIVNDLKGGGSPRTLNTHLGAMMGGQKQLLDNYVTRAAGAGIQRGGMNVAGGMPLESALALQATKGLAGQYASDYANAAQMANQDRASQQSLLSQLMNGITSSGGYQWAGNDGWSGGSPQNWAMSGDQLQALNRAREKADLMVKHREFLQHQQEQQAAQDRAWTIGQRDNQTYDRNQNIKQQDWQNYLNSRGSGNPYRGDLNQPPGAGLSSSGMTNREQLDPLASLRRRAQEQQLMGQISAQKNQSMQSNIQTDSQQRQQQADQFKQDAWMKKYAPYIGATQQWVGAPANFYGNMNNMNLADAMRALNQWSGYRQYR